MPKAKQATAPKFKRQFSKGARVSVVTGPGPGSRYPGTVTEVVKTGALPKTAPATPGSERDHESYVVTTPEGAQCWPDRAAMEFARGRKPAA